MRSTTEAICSVAPVTSWRSSSAVGPCPSAHSSRSRSPASRRANQSLPNSLRRKSRSCASNAHERRYPGHVEGAVDVVEIALRVGGELERVGEQLGVASPHRDRIGGLEELDLVDQLGAVAAHEIEHRGAPGARDLAHLGDVEAAIEPRRLVDEMLQERRPTLGDRHVPESLRLHRQLGRGVCVVLGVARLVEECPPVVVAADRLDHEHHLAGHLDRRAERARALAGTRVEVEMDVALRAQVDSEVGECRLEGGKHSIRGVGDVELGGAEESRHIGRPGFGQADPEPLAEEPVASPLPESLRLVEHLPALRGELVEREAEALVQLVDVGRAELDDRITVDPGGVEVDRVELAVEQLETGALEPLTPLAVGLQRHVLGADVGAEPAIEPRAHPLRPL